MNSGQNYKKGDKLLCRQTKMDNHGVIWKFGHRYEILRSSGKRLFPNSDWFTFEIEQETGTLPVLLSESRLKDYFVVGQKIRKLKLMKLKRK